MAMGEAGAVCGRWYRSGCPVGALHRETTCFSETSEGTRSMGQAKVDMETRFFVISRRICIDDHCYGDT